MSSLLGGGGLPSLFISRTADLPMPVNPRSGWPAATVVQDVAKGLSQVCVNVIYRTPRS